MAAKERATARTRRNDPTIVILEDIRAQNKVVIEAVQSLGQRIDRSIAELRSELLERIERLEAAVRQNSKDIQKNSQDIQRLEAELRGVKEAVGGKVDRVSLAALELRVAALERRVGS